MASAIGHEVHAGKANDHHRPGRRLGNGLYRDHIRRDAVAAASQAAIAFRKPNRDAGAISHEGGPKMSPVKMGLAETAVHHSAQKSEHPPGCDIDLSQRLI